MHNWSTRGLVFRLDSPSISTNSPIAQPLIRIDIGCLTPMPFTSRLKENVEKFPSLEPLQRCTLILIEPIDSYVSK